MNRPIISITTTARTWVWLTPFLLIVAVYGAMSLHHWFTKAPAPLAPHQCHDQLIGAPEHGQVVSCDGDQRMVIGDRYDNAVRCVCPEHLPPLLTPDNALKMLGPGELHRFEGYLFFHPSVSTGPTFQVKE